MRRRTGAFGRPAPARAGAGMPSAAGIAGAALLVGLLAAAMLPVSARAQFDDPDTTAADTTAAPTERGMEGEAPADPNSFLPSYQTTYNVMRQTTDWRQVLNFGTKAEGWDLKADTDFTIGDDTGRSAETRTGNAHALLNWRGIAALPLMLDVKMSRTSLDQPTLQSENESRNLSLSTRVTRRFFGVRNSVSLRTSLDAQNSLSSSTTRSESRESGITGALEWKGNWNPLPDLKLDATWRDDRAAKTSELEDSSADTVRSEDTSKKNQGLNINAGYDPTAWMSARLALGDRSGEEEFFLLQSGKGDLERRVTEARSATLALELRPAANWNLLWNLGLSENLQDYRVRPERATEGDGDEWSGKLKGRVLAADLEANLSRKRDYSEPRISIPNEGIIKAFDGKLQRKLSPKFDARLSWEVRLRQQFYFGSPTEIQDKDEQKVRVDTGLNYSPPGKWGASLGYVRDEIREVEVNQIRAGETNTEENHTVTIGIRYKLSQETSLTQNYYIQASYTTFDFQTKKNNLNATQRIVTTVNSAITPRLNLKLAHNFNLIDSGPFFFDPVRGRVFNRSTRAFRQDLTADLEYKATPWLTITAIERLFRNDNLNEVTGVRTITRNLELREGFKVERSLGGGVRVLADGSYVRSSTAASYWMLKSSINKDF